MSKAKVAAPDGAHEGDTIHVDGQSVITIGDEERIRFCLGTNFQTPYWPGLAVPHAQWLFTDPIAHKTAWPR